MTVTHVVRMWPDEGDPQLGSFVRSHIAALRDAGLQQRVVVWSGRGEQPLPLDGVDVVAGPNVPPGPKGWNAKVRSVLNLGRPDVLHVHGSGGDTAYLLVRSIMQWGQRTPRVVSEHQYFGNGALPAGTLWTHRLANLRTAVSPFLAERFASIGRVDVVPNCWDPPLAHQLRQPHWGGRRVLHVGDWVDATKGISPLLEAWQFHSERNPLDHLTLVGDGVDRSLLEPRVRATPNCSWLGRLAPNDLADEMGRHDVLVVNSPRETFSMVVGQARERGLLVLSTRCGGPESVYRNVRGITTRDGSSHDVADLAATLQALPLASELHTVEELVKFRPEEVAKQFTALYRSVGVKK
ncbi:MAG: glycosyltransferase family 4 protein [Bacteroidota bacterium]